MNKRQIAVLLLFLLLLGGGFLFLNSSTKDDNSTSIALDQLTTDQDFTKQISVLEEVLAMQEDTLLQFQLKFRKGHVTEGKLTNYLTQNEDGYTINLKNNSPVTTPLIIDQLLYVSGGFGSKKYYSFDLKTGKLVWAINLDDDGPSPATHCDSLLIFNTESCTIFAVNRFSGKMEWSHWLGDPLLSSPLVVNNNVYTSYPDKNKYLDQTLEKRYPTIKPQNAFICMEASSGKIKWQKWLDGDVMKAPVSDGAYIYLTTYPGTVYKIDAEKGTIIASIALKATSVPSIVEHKIFITKRIDSDTIVGESIAILDKETLSFVKEFNPVKAPYLDYAIQAESELKFSSEALDLHNGFEGGAPITSGWQEASKNIGQSNVSSLQLFQPSTVLYSKGNIYNLMGNVIYCINPIDEKIQWKRFIEGNLNKEGGVLATTPILTSEHLITVTNAGKVLVLNLETGKVDFEKELDKIVRSAPIASKGKLIVPTTKGELVYVDTKLPTLDGWPMLMKNPMHQMN